LLSVQIFPREAKLQGRTRIVASRNAADRKAAKEAMMTDTERAFVAALTRDLARCAALERESMAILAEVAALTAGRSSQAMV
jgi:hypothetical protein